MLKPIGRIARALNGEGPSKFFIDNMYLIPTLGLIKAKSDIKILWILW
jgi:hypothetical protein